MRHAGSTLTISYDATLDFFESRGRHASADAPQTATMYQDKALAARRDAWEREKVMPLLSLKGTERVLDIGCGYGRWAEALHRKVAEFVGIDFSGQLLRLARQRGLNHTHYQQLSAQHLSPESLCRPGPYDLFICSGILIYLNDPDVANLVSAIVCLAAPTARIYVREPMAVTGARLTLDRHPSEELRRDYSAIYRTPAEYDQLLGERLRQTGFRCTIGQSLYPPELCNRKETEQQIQLWERGA